MGKAPILMLGGDYVGFCRNSFRVVNLFRVLPEVAEGRQPWAKCWNPAGIQFMAGTGRVKKPSPRFVPRSPKKAVEFNWFFSCWVIKLDSAE